MQSGLGIKSQLKLIAIIIVVAIVLSSSCSDNKKKMGIEPKQRADATKADSPKSSSSQKGFKSSIKQKTTRAIAPSKASESSSPKSLGTGSVSGGNQSELTGTEVVPEPPRSETANE